MSAAHTPGPWVVEEGPHWLTVCREDAPFTDGKRDPIVGTRWSGTVTDAERANSRLIAAAPVLLVVAQGMIPRNLCLTNPNVPDSTVVPLDVTMGELRTIAAIVAKALGRTPNEIGDEG